MPNRTCIWPTCDRDVSGFPQLHLCNAHAHVVHDNVQRSIDENERRRAERQAQFEKDHADPAWRANYRALTGSEPFRPGKPVEKRPGVYFVQVGGHIKIGWAGDLATRMRAYPPNSLLLATHPGTRADEKRLHDRFAVHRSHGREWYPLVPVLLEHIRTVVAEHGKPDDLAFAAKPVEVRRPHQDKPSTHLRARSKGGGYRVA